MDSNQQQFRWALLVVDCMKQPSAERFRFVDQEVMPKFDGRPKGTFAWFIREHYYAREKFDKFDLQAATEAPKSKLRNAEFPQGAVETLRTYVTS